MVVNCRIQYCNWRFYSSIHQYNTFSNIVLNVIALTMPLYEFISFLFCFIPFGSLSVYLNIQNYTRLCGVVRE